MLKRKNDRQPQSMEELYPDDYWLDEEDGEEELPVPEMKRKPVSGRLHDEPMVTGYEALERQRGVRRPNRKLTRREKKALKRAQKYEEKLHKEHEKADKKNAKREAKLAARAEKQAVRDAKKNAKKKKSRPAAAPPGQRPAGKAVSGTRSSGTGKKTPDSARDKRITAQQSIPYHEMGRDGICRVQDKFYSKTIRFYDINYQLAQNEDKNAIFENWCDFLNYFDSTIHFQLSFINQHSNMAEYEKVIHINPQEDEFDDLRMEFAQMLNNQLAKGNNGLMRTKYITFGIEAENIREARPKLERIESDILNNFKILGVSAYPLNGEDRLQIMYETFNQDSKVPFHFSYDDVLRTGLSTKDYVAPTSFVFKNGKDFEMGGTMGAVSYLQILAPELTDKMLAEFLEMDSNLMVNFHIQSIDQMKAIKLVKSKVTDINRMKIEEQKKAVRAGYDMDIIPSDLNTYGGEAKRLLEDLQSRNERMFLVTALFLNTAPTKQELENVVFQTAGIAQKYNCALKRLDYQQEPGLMSCLPLAMNFVPIKRALTTTSTAIFVPFTTQELFMAGESIYYGLNALSNNLIMADRKKLKNPNGLILGTPGSGKSFAAKREIANAFIVTKDDIIVCDPEGEYYPLVRAFHGQVIRISPTSHDYINPMDINLDYADDDDPLSLKSDFILSLCELVVGGKNGLEPVEKTVIDRCVRLVYQDFLSDPVPEKMPILEDLYNLLRNQKEQEAQRLATALEIYVNGSLKVFNHTKTVRVGESLGLVVTSGYCNCPICCGQWSGGPTASGAMPTANHTIAVDAANPFVPIGTHVVMNGVEYVVEDTGAFARYGVQFDVYYDNHAAASAHGHQTWEAYIADSNGNQEVQVTTTKEVNRLDVTMTNHSLDAVLRSRMTEEEQERYDAYNKYYGNRDYLFDLNSIPTGSSGFGYDIPADALSDPQFAKMIQEAEKYLGVPYVWGGYSPSGFDCSGFVSWVINNCGNGWNVGRCTADELRSHCSQVSLSEAKPGDLIFFQGTYDTPGASHVGIYVGNNMMIHCGKPVQYTSIASAYWQEHFMAFGRLH